MARFNMETAERFGGGTSGFFSLREDKDTAKVRFMYNTLSEVEGHSVHEIEIDGKKRYVSCLRDYNQPIHNCPLCAAGKPLIAKLFIHLYDVETGEVKVWERGKSFFSKLASLCARHNPLVSTIFEIERNGKKGDARTVYETYVIDTDDVQIADLPPVTDLLGGMILDKTYDDLNFYLTSGYFNENPKTLGRNPEVDKRPQQPAAPTFTRRVPLANTPQDRF